MDKQEEKDIERENGDPVLYQGRQVGFEILNRILLGGGYSNLIIKNALSDKKFSEDDKQAAVNLVYGVLRNLSLIDNVLRSKAEKGKLTVSPKVLNLGRMAVFEILFMYKIPKYATVSEYMVMIKENCGASEGGFMNACLRKVVRKDKDVLLKSVKDAVENLALRYSHPNWYVKKIADFYGIKEASHILRANNNPQPVYFRLNTKRVDKEEFISINRYQRKEYQEVDLLPNCFMLPYGKGGFPHHEYESGWLTPQDVSTQFIPFFLSPEPGDHILDLCCGSGVKTTQLLEIMGDEGEVTAVDIFEHKIQSLKSECERLGLKSYRVIQADISKAPDLGAFSKVLLDAPCSGSGTVRRRPEIKTRLLEKDIGKASGVQDILLHRASKYVKKYGILVYATCSIFREENAERVERFLHEHPDFEPMTDQVARSNNVEIGKSDGFGVTFLPVAVNGCGTYVSVLRRNQ
ncbi:MAG TPA: 16S rRNA (cytosine(967)-C(5))-methyltransferase RsmB [bacterium]|nr:16S rRNA (cytosine(967)-C(5))-methyltransferase RsmB [bacterium]